MRTTTLRGVLTVVVLLALSLAHASAQNLVRGTVYDVTKKPVEGAIVVFDFKERNLKRDVKTDRKGEFLFVGLPSGEYSVTASKEGLSDTLPARISGQEKTVLEFFLKPAAAAGAGPAAPAGLEAAAAGGGTSKQKQEYAAIQAIATAAMEAYKANRHDEAAPKLAEVIAKMPDCADCYMYMGASLFELKRFDEAEAAFKKSVELQPTVEGYTALARFYNAQKQPEKAVEASQKATELSTGAAAAPAAAGGDAKGAASAAPAATGPSSEAVYNEGVILWNSGKFADARPKFEMAVKADPQNADAHYMLGLASLNGGLMAPARAAFEEYLKIAPNGSKAAEVKTFLTQLPK
jgi:tetratricopeptide (TPR) repeat protein